MRGHRGHAYERHPWRKGWPPFLSSHVATQELVSHMGSIDEHVIIGILVPTDPQMFWAVLAHAFTLVGLSVGCADRPNVFPTHWFFSSSVTWRRSGGVL